MSEDLVTLCLLVVSADASQLVLWRQGAALASFPTDIMDAQRAPLACAHIRQRSIDIVLLDEELMPADQALVAKAARAAHGKPLAVLLRAGGAGVPSSALALDGAVGRPASSDEAKVLVDRCAKARLPSRVLVVDDSAATRGLVRRIFTQSRFSLEVEEAAGGSAALKQVLLGHFDIVVLDSDMPGLDGLATLSELKRSRPRIEVIMMTSSRDGNFEARARAAGAAGCLRKPFYPADADAVLLHLFGLDGSDSGATWSRSGGSPY